MDRFEFLQSELEQLQAHQLYRRLRTVESAQGTVVRIEGAEVVLFCSNNYLNLAEDKRIKEAAREAIKIYGVGCGASRLICGNMEIHNQLEKTLAGFFNKESALVFPAGYMANHGLITSVAGPDDLIILDKLDHASIIDAVRACGADFRTYRRGDLGKIEKILSQNKHRRKFIITESVFSMDGDRADLRGLSELKDKYGAVLIVDEAHAVGCMGNNGAGLADEMGIVDKVDIVVGTLSKALGSGGGFVAGPEVVIKTLINKARSFIYTTAATVPNCAAALKAIEIIQAEPERREKLKQKSEYLREKLEALKLDTGKNTTHIIPVIIGSESRTLSVSRMLFGMGFFVAAIRPPTVAAKTCRLRISLQTNHTVEQMDGLVESLARAMERKVYLA